MSFNSQLARYVRMFGIQRATEYGFSLFEMEVFGPGDTSDARLRSILINGKELNQFTSDRFDYDYVLADGSQEIPELGVQTRHPDAAYFIEHPTSLPGPSRITSISPDKSDTLRYHIRWIPSNYELLWSDEFNNDGKIYLEGKKNAVDSSKWFHQTILPLESSWFNGEIQHYTDRITNAYVSNGSLKIIAKRETFTDQGHTKSFTSARLNSKAVFPITKGFGKIEFKAKIPEGAGTWPAVWTLGQNIKETGAYWSTKGYGTADWPACGEIDIMEHWGKDQNFITSAIHTPSSFGNTENKGGQYVPSASSAFHTYSLEWTPEQMSFLVDGMLHYTYAPESKDEFTWPFDVPQYLIINIAIEGDIDANGALFEQAEMEIDYIRVYERRLASIDSVSLPKSINIFPNPSHGNFHITSDQYISEVIILDLHGREQFHESFQSQDLIIDHELSPGMYVIYLRTNSQWVVRKLWVQ